MNEDIPNPYLDEDADPIELARCALANLENLESLLPTAFGSHPLFKLTKMQLEGSIAAMERQ